MKRTKQLKLGGIGMFSITQVNGFNTGSKILYAGELRYNGQVICYFYEDEMGQYYPSNISSKDSFKKHFKNKNLYSKFNLVVQTCMNEQSKVSNFNKHGKMMVKHAM